jgi:hypothetical protein
MGWCFLPKRDRVEAPEEPSVYGMSARRGRRSDPVPELWA